MTAENTEHREETTRYRAEHVLPAPGADHRATVQDALDAGSHKGWHLVGATNGPEEGGVLLLWDTQRPSFGRRSY